MNFVLSPRNVRKRIAPEIVCRLRVPAFNSLVAALIVSACVGCGSSPSSPTSPSPPASAPPPSTTSGPIHDTLTDAGTGGINDAVGSERSGGFDRQVYDDFVSPTAATIRTLAWQGSRTMAHPPTGFYVSFIADEGGGPLRQGDGSGRPRPLNAETHSTDRVSERLVVTRACDNLPQELCGFFEYSVTLTTPFTATAGTRYWVLIQAESPLNAASGWSWRKGKVDNGYSLSNIANLTFPWDFSFALRP